MLKLYQYISSFLLGIFVFPIFFQPAHMLWGHPHESANCGVYIDTGISLIQEQAIIFDEDDYCPICEYKPATNNLPSIPSLKIALPNRESGFYVIEVAQLHQSIGTEKSPRAPPVLLIA